MIEPSLPTATEIGTMGDESILVASHGHDAIRIAVNDPRFGRIATVRIDPDQATHLAALLAAHSAARPRG